MSEDRPDYDVFPPGVVSALSFDATAVARQLTENGYITCSYLVAKTFGINEAIFVEYLVGWGAAKEDQWRYRTAVQIEEDTCLTTQQQRTVRARLKALGVLKEGVRGVPAKLHFHVEWRVALFMMSQISGRDNKPVLLNQQTSSAESTNQFVENPKLSIGRVNVKSQQEESESSNLPKINPTHNIVVAFMIEANVETLANPGKAYAQAKMLADNGITAADIPEFYEWLASWKIHPVPTLGLMYTQIDNWTLSKMVHPEDEGVIWTGSGKTLDQWNHRERREAREMEQRERERTRAWKATLEDDKRRSEAAER